MFFAYFLVGVKYLFPELLCKGKLTLPQGAVSEVTAAWSHASVWLNVTGQGVPLAGLATWPFQERNTGEQGALTSPTDLRPKDKGLHSPGQLFPAPPESIIFVPRLPASPGWKPSPSGPGVEKGRK